jgi:iron-only hydrogenase group A
MNAIKDKSKHVVFQIAPAIRVAVAEEFGLKPGERMIKNEMVSALKKLGSNVTVFDTNFTADLTIIEEGNELIERLTRVLTGKKRIGGDHMNTDLPMLTSCCPAWINFVEKYYPKLLTHVSSCKSPQQMAGAVAKSYWAKDIKKVNPKDVVVVSIMPCVAKKAEKARDDQKVDNIADVDYSLTTREFAKMLKQNNINLAEEKGAEFDKVMGEGSGAAVIFGATGGVMEAALRTAYAVITGRNVPFKNLDITPVRGMDGIKEAPVKFENVLPEFKHLEGATVKVAIAHGLANTRKVMDIIMDCKEQGKPAPWHFIEIMACPGGCIGGGGQPKPTNVEIRKQRANLIYQEDKDLPIRMSHENKEVADLYKNFLIEPLGHLSHHLLHKPYSQQFKNNNFVNFKEADGIESMLANFPTKQRDMLVPILINEVDRLNFISDAAIIKIAEHVGCMPASVEATISAYHYLEFHRHKRGENVVYLCDCHNCRMKGRDQVKAKIENILGIKEGETTKDGKITLTHANWLAWCVNDAPSCMIKQRGSDHIDIKMGLNAENVEEFLKNISKHHQTMPSQTVKFSSLKRKGENMPSLFFPITLDGVMEKAASMGADSVINEVINSGLQGRGGAGFPTGMKWKFAKSQPTKEKLVVCNADEGLPSTVKDWFLLLDPIARERVIMGMGICARSIGAKKAYLYLRYEYRNITKEIGKTIMLMKAKHPLLQDVEFEIRLGAGPYMAGEETALFESIQGRGAKPWRDRSVYPTQAGLFGVPTVINNVETFSAIPYIIKDGSKKFASVGAFDKLKGPKIFNVIGDVAHPTIIEFPLGLSVEEMLREVPDVDLNSINFAEIGGTTEPFTLRNEFASTKVGFGKGFSNAVGSMVLFGKERNIVDLYNHKLKFMEEESCKQCAPCREGSKVLYDTYLKLKEGKCSCNLDSLLQVADTAENTSICAHGKALGALYKKIAEQTIPPKA